MSENRRIDPKQMPRLRGPGMGGGPHGMVRGGEKARDFKGTMKKLIKYLSAYKISIISVFILAALSASFSIAGPKILSKAITKIFEGVMNKITGQGSGIDFEYVGKIILILIGLYGLSALFGYLQGWIMSGVAMKVTYRFRKEISEKINRLPLKYFESTNQGEILSRITNDVDTITQTLNQSLTQIITSVTTVVGVLIMMFTINWLMTLVALLIIPLSSLVIAFIVKHSQMYFREQQDYLGHVNGHVEEVYGGHNIVKAFNGEKKSIEKFDVLNNTLYGAAWKSQFLTGIMMPLMNVIGNLGYVAVTVLGSWLVIKNAIEVGDIQAFIQYIRSFTQPIAQIANISNILQQTAACAERVFEFLEEEEEVPDNPQPVKIEDIKGNVEFRNVRFGYRPDKMVINNFSASIKAGQKVAIVGPTGAGKTTIVKLLMRFYDVNEGAILIDGHDIRDFTREDLRSLFGMVLQDTWLYNGTIMDNIRYGRLDATDEEVIKAAKAAHVDSFVRTLPGGYNMVLNEETTNISQGQKQLLTIARAILKDPKILILDEATSSVDTLTEIQIQKAMDYLMKGRTSFIIAHRLSTIRDADLILVMNHGDIIEQGTHEELLKKGGFYASLYNSQFEKEEEMAS
ncbi:ABC transporter ATP-binding protein [Thermoanaerobacter thermohydrosulfuricus]|uniref:ABC-type multidrug transport system, ATPase and permease components n=1 Tax=Thermoanaerobacter thermohydrosulfuricus WC1 TaxID=1198630 RepID=M8DID6_THETY|nr:MULTISPECIES: ABC transporter ATP-binding protein [Thermoanaerobacter]EGD52318.1 ABC transporter related protein [Thermoanaerobacter ethanolicus JW 200]EMT39817.1 ABC-type multidrug transport system, ATPase and permease components [Thermoanaerobacter thermohydrosulfuricus WC1]UZQ82815.1 ABC transporter ATP-binding protein/permease [Thermoanaerobacter sp. RKWS2]SFE15449.1 ATP-binding cassette, subfamily B [Thermoanaerobacter thermohydrosulfuricus]